MTTESHTIDTKYGALKITPQRVGQVRIEAEPLTVNGVEYRLHSAWWLQPADAFPESEAGTWQPYEPGNRGSIGYLHLSRQDAFRNGGYDAEPTAAASRTVRKLVQDTVTKFAALNPEAMGSADRETAEEDAARRITDAEKLEAEAQTLREEAALLRAGGRLIYERDRIGRTTVCIERADGTRTKARIT